MVSSSHWFNVHPHCSPLTLPPVQNWSPDSPRRDHHSINDAVCELPAVPRNMSGMLILPESTRTRAMSPRYVVCPGRSTVPTPASQFSSRCSAIVPMSSVVHTFPPLGAQCPAVNIMYVVPDIQGKPLVQPCTVVLM